MFKTKDSTVNLKHLHPFMTAALPVIGAVVTEFLGYTAVITSGCDGTHSGIFHHLGCATDWRIWDEENSGRFIDQERKLKLAEKIQTALDNEFGEGIFRIWTKHDSHLHIDLNGTSRRALLWETQVWRQP